MFYDVEETSVKYSLHVTKNWLRLCVTIEKVKKKKMLQWKPEKNLYTVVPLLVLTTDINSNMLKVCAFSIHVHL